MLTFLRGWPNLASVSVDYSQLDNCFKRFAISQAAGEELRITALSQENGQKLFSFGVHLGDWDKASFTVHGHKGEETGPAQNTTRTVMDPCCSGTVWEAFWERVLILQQEASTQSRWEELVSKGERPYPTPRPPKWFSGWIVPRKQDHHAYEGRHWGLRIHPRSS